MDSALADERIWRFPGAAHAFDTHVAENSARTPDADSQGGQQQLYECYKYLYYKLAAKDTPQKQTQEQRQRKPQHNTH